MSGNRKSGHGRYVRRNLLKFAQLKGSRAILISPRGMTFVIENILFCNSKFKADIGLGMRCSPLVRAFSTPPRLREKGQQRWPNNKILAAPPFAVFSFSFLTFSFGMR